MMKIIQVTGGFHWITIPLFFMLLYLIYYPITSYTQDISNLINEIKLSDNMYLLIGPDSNVLVFFGKDGTILVDSEMKSVSDKLKEKISEITDEPIKFIINTHYHHDHTEGNEVFGKDGAIIISHDLSRQRLITSQFTSFDNMTSPPLPVIALPIITYSNNMTIFQNDDEIKIFHIENAHTDGDSVVYFSNNNVLYLGDLFSDEALPYVDKESNGTIDGMIAGLKKIKPLINNETRILGGHSHDIANINTFDNYLKLIQDCSNVIKEHKTDNLSKDAILSINPCNKLDITFSDQSYVTSENFTDFVMETIN